MRYSVFNFVRILGVLATLSLFAAPLQADPIVMVTPGGTGATNINSTQTFIVGVTHPAGTLTAIFRNNTDVIFVGLRFFQEVGFQSVPLQGNADPFFSEGFANNFSIEFLQGHQGTGILPNTVFTVTFTGFSPGTTILANATVPEPTTLLLLSAGLAGVAFKARNKFKERYIRR